MQRSSQVWRQSCLLLDAASIKPALKKTYQKSSLLLTPSMLQRRFSIANCIHTNPTVKNKRSGLSILPFSSLTFIFFLIYFSLFYFLELGLGLE